MRQLQGIGLPDVQQVYSGAEGELWELLMGQQIHIGGLRSSARLADAAGIGAGMSGVDLCCATGAGMRFLVRFRQAAHMHGVDATPHMLDLARRRAEEEGLVDRMTFTRAEVCATGLPAGQADFVWGEDAWCYVSDKPGLIAEAARLVKPGGTIAFTDWLEGPASLTGAEAERFMRFMKFPSFATLDDYRRLLAGSGCAILRAEDTGQFAPHVELYQKMIGMQLTYDALRILGFDSSVLEAIGTEFAFVDDLARQGKIIQGLVVAQKSRAGG